MPTTVPPTEPLSYAEAREKAHEIARQRREAVENLNQAAIDAAEAEVSYHRAKATCMATLIHQAGIGVTEAQERVKGEPKVAAALHGRELAKSHLMIAQERLASIDGERASFHRLIEWSRQLDGALNP